jgi:cytochrome c oxidase subunit 2
MEGHRASVALLAVAFLAFASASGSARADEQQLARGKQLFALCEQCHGTNAGGMQLSLAPSIAGMGEWYINGQLNKFRDGQRASNFDDISGFRMRPMARWLHNEDDVKAAAAYVSSLPPVVPATLQGGDAKNGAELYATCSGCHGAQAEGVEAVGGPSLSHSSDWYLYSSLKNFKQGIRGSDPRDAQGAAMRGMSMLLADDQAIKDVIAYIMTLPLPGSQAAAAGGGSQ